MASRVSFNGVRYLLSKINAQAAIGSDIALKRTEVVLSIGDTHYDYIADPKLPDLELDLKEAEDKIHRIAVFPYNGKFYVMNGVEQAQEKFAESNSGVIKAKLISKHMLKKCAEGHAGAAIVTEADLLRREREREREERAERIGSYSRDNRDSRDSRDTRPPRTSFNNSIGFNSNTRTQRSR